MMEKLKKKLNSQSGESLAETLVSVLIAALALVMLAGAMTAASGIVNRSKEKLEGEDGYYAQIETLMKLESGTEGSMKISSTGSDSSLDQSVEIVYNINESFDNTPVIAYKTK